MLTFYDCRGVRVTNSWYLAGGRRFNVAELENLRVVRGPLDSTAKWALGTGAYVLVLTTLLGYVLPPIGILAGGSFGLTMLGVGSVAMVRHPPIRVLWAEYRGKPVSLFATRDQTELGKLLRAMQRAAGRNDTRRAALL
jgi:uncharacterized protein DUF6232